jgi:hypothetical protein
MPRSLLKKYAAEFMAMKIGQRIINPTEVIPISKTAQFTRKSLKHFIESRQKSGNNSEDILYLLDKAPEVTEHPQVNIFNPNQEKHPGSVVLGRWYADKNKAVMAILDRGGEVRDIISLHFRKKSDFENLLKFYSEE